jgi:hypothetical protein
MNPSPQSSQSSFNQNHSPKASPSGFNHNWKVSDSFKVAKLRVSTKEELRRKRESDTHRHHRQSGSSKGVEAKASAPKPTTSDAKSYLKSRRQKARDEKRQDILGILDNNLEKLDDAIAPKHDNNSPSTSPVRRSRSANDREEGSGGHNRLFALNPFRRSASSRDGLKKKTTFDRRNTRRRKEQKEAIENLKQTRKDDKDQEMKEILEEVLRKYPKEKCKTFADHKEFAFAELSLQSNEKKDLHMNADKYKNLKSMLHDHLTNTIGEDDSVADSAMVDCQPQSFVSPKINQPSIKGSGSPHQRVNSHSVTSPKGKRYTETSTSSPSHRRHSDANESSSPRRTRATLTGTLPLVSPQKSPVKERNRVISPITKSSKALNLTVPGDSGMRLAPFIEKDDHTTTTENDDESTLVPVVKLLVVDPSGQIGNYSGTICVNTGKPHGTGRLEYKDGGSYQGDWNQGSWSGYGRHVKPNGDVYEGNFFENSKHGMGIYKYKDGKRIFEGRYVMGQRVDGQMTYGDGSVYKGQWYEGKRHGRGTYRFKDSSVYKGEFLQDVIHGVGQLVWPDGAKYVGEWNQGMFASCDVIVCCL